MNDSPLTIRPANAADVDTIAEFNSVMALESEDVTLDQDVLKAGVRAALADASLAFYLIAEADGGPVGQLMVTFEWSDWRDGWVWWVQSVYVKAGYRRRGIYRRLYGHLQELAAQQGNVRGMRLYVMRDNVAAKRTYESLGMAHSEYDLYQTDF